jgi:CHASE3 domain sensor protein
MSTAGISLRIVVFKLAHGVWLRRGEVASAAAPYSVYSGLYLEAVVSSVASAVALAEVGQFKEAVQYVQKAAKALYEAAREVFEKVKVSLQRLVELFVEAVARVLAWFDEHKAYLFLMAAVAAGVIALSVALNIWGLVEVEKLAYAASLTPFIPAGVKEYSREEVFNMLKNESDPYEKFKEVAKAANAGKVKLAEPWESLRVLIMPKKSEEERLMWGGGAKLYSKYRKDEKYKRALFYATLALEEAFGVYRSALRKLEEAFDVHRKDVEKHEKVVQRMDVGEEPFKQVVYVADLGRLRWLAKEEEEAFENALSTLRRKLNEYAVRYDLEDLLNVEESVARKLVEAKEPELSEFKDVSFGTKAFAALIAYREYALGRRSLYGTAAWHWLEVGGSTWLLYYTPSTAYHKAERAEVVRPATVEEMVAETLRRLFLKPGVEHYSRFVEELTKGGRLTLMLEDKSVLSYMFKLYRLEEDGGLVDLGMRLWISKVGEGERASITYALIFDDVERWQGFFKQELEAAEKAAVEVGGRLSVEDLFPYALGWVDSDVAISGKRLEMGTSHLWQLAETHALFNWSNITVIRVNLTLEGPKLQFLVHTSLEKLNEIIKRSVEGGWLHMLGTKAGLKDLIDVKSWEGLKQWIADHWNEVINAVERWLKDVEIGPGFDLAKALRELKDLKNKLGDDKTAREVIAPALLLIQAERLGVNEETLRYFGAVISGAIGGDGYVSAARRMVGLASGEREIALLWEIVLAAYGVKAKVEKSGRGAFQVVVSGGDAAKLAALYFLYGAPLLKGNERIINHKLVEAIKLGAEALNIRWEKLREIKGGAAADLIISAGSAVVKYNIYLRHNEIELRFSSTNRSRVELAVRLLELVGVSVEVNVKKRKNKIEWQFAATTNMLATGREELRKTIAKIVEEARNKRLIDADKAKRWLEKLERGLTLMEGWPKYYVGLVHGAIEVIYHSTDPNSIRREVQWLKKMGLEEWRHFTVKMPKDGGIGYVRILKEGLAYIAWLSVYGNKEQRKLAETFIELILLRAEDAGTEVRKKAEEIVEKGKEWSSLTLKGFEKKVEVNGREYMVKVLGWSTELEESQRGKKLLRLKITAEINGVRSDYTITFSRHKTNNKVEGFAYVRADAPGGREADAERLAALIKALTGKEPRIRRKSDGVIVIACSRAHLDGFARYAEFAGAIEEWLKETSR